MLSNKRRVPAAELKATFVENVSTAIDLRW